MDGGVDHHLFILYRNILKYKFKVTSVIHNPDNGWYTIQLEKWLPPMYAPDRFLEEKITLIPRAKNE